MRSKVDAPTDGSWVAHFIELKFVNKHARVDTVLVSDLVKDMTYSAEKFERSKDFSRVFPEFGGFPKDLGRFFDFTTEVSVFPDTFPYPDCTGEACGVQLV